ncbi:hypothetical protein OQA88_11760 [Cercophora sp. LCS_1]
MALQLARREQSSPSKGITYEEYSPSRPSSSRCHETDNMRLRYSIALSEPFRFTIGPEKRVFTMHSALVASQSPALDRLVNGAFKEAREGNAELEDVDEETFIRFMYFAYTGRYGDVQERPDPVPAPDTTSDMPTAPEGEAKKDDAPAADSLEESVEPEPEPEPKPVSATLSWGAGWQNAPLPTRKKITDSVIFQALNRKYTAKVASLTAEGPDVPGGGMTPLSSNVVLSHAKLFVFAEFWGVDRLAGLALQKLGNAMQDLKITWSKRDRKKKRHVENVVELVKYCYGSDDRPEVLVSLVTLYAAYKLPVLWKNSNFRKLFAQHGGLAAAVVGAIVGAED